jgi:plasmid maintenance system killer protein
MTGWDILNNVVGGLPFVTTAFFLIAAFVAFIIFIAGFSKHGVNFIKYGFKQSGIDDLLEKLATKEDINKIEAKFDARFVELDAKIEAIETVHLRGLDAKIEAMETNHFGHLKDFLTELTSILLDKGVINNQDKARLDNKLRGI